MVKQGAGTGIVKNKRDFLRIQQKVDRYDNGAGFQDAEIGQREPVGIDAIESNAIAFPNAPPNQRGSHLVADPVKSGEIQRAPVENYGLLAGEAGDTGPEHVR